MSAGASDNAVSVAVALEVLEVLSRRPTPLEHAVVFLFNGAEEKALLGAHGFITQHKVDDDFLFFPVFFFFLRTAPSRA